MANERKEILWRILVAIVSGVVLAVWKGLVFILAIINLIIVLIKNKRDKQIADFCEYWNTELYRYVRYLTFETNERPFPFSSMQKLGKFAR